MKPLKLLLNACPVAMNRRFVLQWRDIMAKPAQDHQQKTRAYKIIGTPRPKVDAYAKVTGRALFADDIMLPRMLYGRLLRSPYPHARILSIVTSRALALP